MTPEEPLDAELEDRIKEALELLTAMLERVKDSEEV